MTPDSPTVADPTLLEAADLAGATRLVAYIEEEDGSMRSRVVRIPEGTPVTIGRSRSCTIHIDSPRISRRHARLWREGEAVWVEDLGSRNGTVVNGVTIAAPTRLGAGDELSLHPLSAVLTTAGSVTWRSHDPSALDDRLAAEVDRAARYRRRFALAMIRLEGDEVDRAIERVAGRMRRMDFLAEYGPGELAVLLPELSPDEAEEATRRLTTAARGAVTDPRASLEVRAGIAAYPDHASQPGELIDRARAALRNARTRRQQTVVGSSEPPPSGDIVAEAPATQRLLALVDKVAQAPMTVLIVGETGAGKEITAAEIHRRSQRASGPFVKLNCACLPSTLLESELFGHERGAFTGAERQKHGFFEAADGGTLFLDEIGEIEPALQAKLLRVLESRTIIRVGGTRELPVDVRVVCATNRDLEREVSDERFRSDLFYRIAGFTIVVPPLRERVGDIVPLAERFVAEIAGELGQDAPVIAPEARAALESYAWPGNIRELRNAMERAAVLQSSGAIELGDLPTAIADSSAIRRAPSGDSARDRLAEVERATIVEALRATGGNQTRAARELGITRRALIYRMEKYGLKLKSK